MTTNTTPDAWKAAARRTSSSATAGRSTADGATDHIGRAAYLLLLLMLTVAAFPDEAGASIEWIGHGLLPGPLAARTALELFAFLTATVMFLARSGARRFSALAVPLSAFAGIVLLGVVQLIPVPENLLHFVAPLNASIYHGTAKALSAFGATTRPRISLAPGETFQTVILVLALGCIFLSAAALAHGRARRRTLAASLVALGMLRAVRAWLTTRATGGPAPEAIAAFLEIALALGFGVVWTKVLSDGDLRNRSLDRAENVERRIVPLTGPILVWCAAAILLAWNGPGAATLAAAVTAPALLLTASRHPRGRPHTSAAIALALGAVGVLAGAAWLDASAHDAARPAPPAAVDSAVRSVAVDAWKHFPLWGSGLGALAEGLVRFQPSSLSGRVTDAASDGLGLLVTGGLVGAGFCALLVCSLLVALLKAWRLQKHREESAYALAGAGALVSLLGHGLFTSVLWDPPTAAVLAAVLGMAWASATADSRDTGLR
jgi:hypothetical protein